MNNTEMLSGRQKLAFGMINNIYVSSAFVLEKMQKIDPNIKINSVADILLKLTNKKLTERKKINERWHYKLTTGASHIKITTMAEKKILKESRTKISKAFNGKSINARMYVYLCKNIGRIVSAKIVADNLKLKKIPGTIYGDLKKLCSDGFLVLASTNPITYEVLPSIVDSNKKRPKTDVSKMTSPAVVEPTAQAELFEVPQQALPDFQNLNMGDTINSIIQLQQQVTIYKTALEHVASILEQAGIIDSE